MLSTDATLHSREDRWLRSAGSRETRRVEYRPNDASHFSFPLFPRHLPFTALRRSICLKPISQICPLLSFQPLSETHANTLDMMIAHKVHAYLGMPFHFNSSLLTLPVSSWGFGFTSIARLNSTLAVSGLQQDLNHHIPILRNIARVTLADWMCQLNRCQPPLHITDSSPSFSRQKHKLPCSWLSAYNTLKTLSISFHATDLSYLLTGDVSLTHLHNLTSHILPSLPPSRMLSNFSKFGFHSLRDVGSWVFPSISPLPTSFRANDLSFPPSQYFLTHDWPSLRSWLTSLPDILPTLSPLSPLLLLPRTVRQNLAELSLLRISEIPLLSFPFTAPPHLFASNGSASHTTISPDVTCAVFGNGRAFPLSLHSFRNSASILIAETYGILTALLLTRKASQSNVIYTDHLNCVNLLTHAPQTTPQSLFMNPARSIYRWILDVLHRKVRKDDEGFPSLVGEDEEASQEPVMSSLSTPSLTISHVKAYTDNSTTPSDLNRLVDFVASRAHRPSLSPPSVPLPTFMMDDFMPFTNSLGFFDTPIASVVENGLQAVGSASSVASSHFYDHHPPPQHPYTQETSSYSAVVQLYSRSNQLDSAFTLSDRL